MACRSIAVAAVVVLAASAAPWRPATSAAPPSIEVAMSLSPQHQVPAMQAHRIGTGPPLALVGGGLTGWASWEPHQQRLAEAREVARLQLLSVAYGLENRELPQGYSIRFESAALAAALDGLGWTEAIDLAAWSFGALVSLDFALDNPHRIRTLVLIEPPAFWVLPDGGRGDDEVRKVVPILRSMHGDISEAQLERFAHAAGLVPPGAAPRSLPQWSFWMDHRRSLRNSNAPLDHHDEHARLEAFDRPVLLVTGTGTPPWLRRIIDALAKRIPGARLVEMPAGHAPQLVSMDRFLAEMALFQSSAADRETPGQPNPLRGR
jgi:pimeloyl-ACP methyl ester carboxylesterase